MYFIGIRRIGISDAALSLGAFFVAFYF